MSGLPSWARVGAKVVCVNAEGILGPDSAFGDERAPLEGNIYTVRDIIYPDSETPCFLLEEIANKVREYHFGAYEFSFRASRFRPLVTDSDDNEIEAQFYRRTLQRKTQRIPHLGDVH